MCCIRNLMTGEGFEVGLEPDDEQQHCDTEITERPDEVEIGNSGHAQHEARCEEVDERWEARMPNLTGGGLRVSAGIPR